MKRFHKMAAIYHLESSGILSTALLLLAAVGSVGITLPHGGRNIPAVAALQDHPRRLAKGNEQKSSTSTATNEEESPVIPHPPGALVNQEQTRKIVTENKKSTPSAASEETTPSTHSHAEVLPNKITKTLWSLGHPDPTRYKRETFDPEVAGEAPRDPQIIGNAASVLSASSSSGKDVSRLAQNLESEMSTLDNMYLCDHPPETFSPNFLGSSWKACSKYDRKWMWTFRDTLELCDTLYSLTEPNSKTHQVGQYKSEIGTVKLITQESYVRVCLPLFRRFNKCEERNFLTVCQEDRVVFFNSSQCPHASSDISTYLAGFRMKNDTECFVEFCEGRQTVVDAEVGGLVYRIMDFYSSCSYMTYSLKHIYRKYNGTIRMLYNVHWPCCYPFYMVMWAGHPEAHGLNGAWSYLPVACQAGEVLLLVLVGCVMAGSIGGNMLVLVVMLGGGHHGQESNLFRTSLASADLLKATFVIVPSFIHHLRPFFSPPTYFMLTPDMKIGLNPGNVTTYVTMTESSNRQSGFTIFQSLLFNTTSTASLLMLLILSVERFVITGRFLRYRDYFNYCRTVVAIAISWTTSFVCALWFAAHNDGKLGAWWLPFEKLPAGAAQHGQGGLRLVIYEGQFVIFLMLGISVVTFSVLAMWNFASEQLHVAKEWRSLKMKASRRYSRDNRHVLTTMMLMLVIFLTSTIPLGINIVFNSMRYDIRQHSLFSYLAWWLFMASSALNPWIYNFRSRQFKEDLSKFRCQALRAWRRQRLHTEESQPLPSSNLQSDSSWQAAESKTE